MKFIFQGIRDEICLKYNKYILSIILRGKKRYKEIKQELKEIFIINLGHISYTSLYKILKSNRVIGLKQVKNASDIPIGQC